MQRNFSAKMQQINKNTNNSGVETPFNVEQNEVLTGNSSEYLIEALLGQGTFGKVTRCKNLTTNELVAVKVINDYSSPSEGETEMLKQLLKINPDKNNLLKFKEDFIFRNHFCVVTEMLDMSLFDFMRCRDFTPLHICEIRAIAQQMLVALKALKSINVVHADIKPDNIMLVNHQSQPFKVKLIDFGLATEVPNLQKKGIIQNLAYRAPEVLLRYPVLDEGIDMFTLGSVLAFLFLADHLYPLKSEYEALRMMIQLNGKADSDFFDAAYDTKRYFNLVKKVPQRLWRLKSLEEYSMETGETVEYHHRMSSHFFSLDGLMAMQPERLIPTVHDDTSAFISLLKKMLEMDPRKRITPCEALNHEFVTMEHLSVDNDGPYLVPAKIIMGVCCSDEQNCISAEPAHENIRTSDSCCNKDPKPVTAASLNRTSFNDVSNGVPDHRIEGDVRSSGTSEKMVAENDTPKSRFRKQEAASVQRSLKKDEQVEKHFNVEQNEVLTGNSSEYLIEALLGQGTFGKVTRCKNLTTNELVAVKVMNDYSSPSEGETEMLKQLLKINPDKNNLLKFKEDFVFRNHFCVVTEMLDMSLFDFMRCRDFTPLHICEIRAIAQQILVALKALKSINVVHADIKPDNIMLVNHQSQPFKVKLIDFGLATEVPNLQKKGIIQNLAYRAPEVLLRYPVLDEGIDMFTLGSVLAFLFLADHLYPLKSEYEALRMMIQLNGKADSDFFDAAYDTKRYFNLVKKVPQRLWRLKSLEEYSMETGETVEYHDRMSSHFFSLDGLMAMQPERMIPTVHDDTSAFISLLKKMLEMDPRKRITPCEALNHEFVTMEHLSVDNDGPYVVPAKIIMAVCCSDEQNCISAEPAHENIRTSDSCCNKDPKPVTAASLNRTSFNDVSNGVPDQRIEGDVRSSGTSEKMVAENDTPKSRFRKQEAASVQRSLKKDEQVEKHFNVEQNEVLTGNSSEYLIEALLGQGTFGKVTRCKNLTTNELVAVKVINDYSSPSEGETEMLKQLLKINPDKNNLLKFKEDFVFRNHFCVVTEMLDMSLFDFMRCRDFTPLHICEIRAIAQQMLVALKALKSINVVHADIKPDNIMLVNHQSQPFKVKLIDFGLATEVPNLQKKGIIQNLAYRAPEVLLRYPVLDEGIDMFTLGSVLAFLFLADHLYPLKSEYEALRMMIQLNGKADSDFFDAAYDTKRYFNLVKKVPQRLWRLKSLEEYSMETGETVEYHDRMSSHFFSLDGLMAMQPERMIPTVHDDTSAFISLLKKMLEMDPRKRITPCEALNHEFVTMEHLSVDNDGPYVVPAKIIMGVCCSDEQNCISAEPAHENSNKDPKPVTAASLNRTSFNDVSNGVPDQRIEGDVRSSGTSEKMVAENDTPKSRFRKQEAASAPRTGRKHKNSFQRAPVENGPCEGSYNKGEEPPAHKGKTSETVVDRSKSYEANYSRHGITAVPPTDRRGKLDVLNKLTHDVTSCKEKITSTLGTERKDLPEEPAMELTEKLTAGGSKPSKKRKRRKKHRNTHG